MDYGDRVYTIDSVPYVHVEVDWHNMESLREKLIRRGRTDAVNWSYEMLVQFALVEASLTHGP
jgi:hypothetical protein